jgi:hypothetical protein
MENFWYTLRVGVTGQFGRLERRLLAGILRTMRLAIPLVAMVACYAGTAHAQAPCPDNGNLPVGCTKEIRIWNNSYATIYPVVEGVIQKTDALNCTLAAKGGGDVWLQAALGDTAKCHTVVGTYYIYINPTAGVATGKFVSINLPWWSKRLQPAPDTYVDWWRGGRVYIFDDKNALNDSFALLQGTPQVKWAEGSPVVSCKNVTGNACIANQLQIYQVPPAAAIATRTPFQLNEFTFADVSKVTNNGMSGGKFLDLNQNYNVSNVDQIYLPIAIEPVREPADIGYMGTTMTLQAFRKALRIFTGADLNSVNPPYWPIYNNPVVKGKLTYPNAGLRVPSTFTVFNYYMEPAYFPTPFPPNTPEIVPASPPSAIANMMSQWNNCVKGTGACLQNSIYKAVNSTFASSYATYLVNCTPPSYLQPVKGTNPPAPTLYAFLRYVYGWVPFNQPCKTAVPELPTTNVSRVPIDYINVQYNYLNPAVIASKWFNPYVQLVHGEPVQGGLGANAYAFSIDDQSSFLSNDGGSTPGGLIIDVGGNEGLPNKTQVPPPLPPYYPLFDFVVALGPPGLDGSQWARYGICSTDANQIFPTSANGAYAFGVDPVVQNISATNPCPITLADTKNRKYQMIILRAGIPPAPIWPAFMPSSGRNFDTSVLNCPTAAGIVPPASWCNYTNELANPTPKPPTYSLSARGPLN